MGVNARFKATAIIRSLIANKATAIDSLAAILIILFLYTAVTKTFHINSTIAILKATPFLQQFPASTAWTVVALEYVISLLLFVPAFRKTGLYASLVLMTCFTIYIALMEMFLPKLPCSCGGVISRMTWTQHLLFNLLFTLISFVAIYLYNKDHNKH